MPTYEYRCPEGHAFETFQRMSDDPVAECPECGKKSERILSGGAGFLFKGDGFYITDYRSDSYRAAAKKDAEVGGGTKSSSSESGGSKGDSGPKSDSASKPGRSSDSKAGGGGGSSSKSSESS